MNGRTDGRREIKKQPQKPRHSPGGGLKMDQTCWRGKWVERDAPLVSCVTVWVCLSCLTAEGNKLLKSFRLSVSLHFCHFQTTLSATSATRRPVVFKFSSSTRLLGSSSPPPLSRPTCGFIGQLSDDSSSVLFNALPGGVQEGRSRPTCPGFTSQKRYSELKPLRSRQDQVMDRRSIIPAARTSERHEE